MKVTIETDIKHRGNPRGSGEAKATIIFIDKNGSRHEREAAAAVENDTKNALTLQIVTAALRILNKPCDVELQLDNEYIKSVVNNGWLENWRQQDWKKANGKEPANVELWKNLYICLNLHKINFI